ncbi:MAG: class I SAM-dependent methyltransferase [Pseudomonadota bacterium]
MSALADIAVPSGAEARACPHCGAREAKRLTHLSRDGWRIVQCAVCGFVYLENPPGHAALSEAFAWEKGLDAEKDRRLKTAPAMYGVDYATRFRTGLFQRSDMAKYVDWFEAEKHGGGAVLDIGCAQGDRIEPPFTPYGIEISKALAEKADAEMRARGGQCLHGPGAEAIWGFDEALFDGIVMRSYLEHEEEPMKVLKGAHRALKPTGAVYVKVPNYGSANRVVTGRNWCGIRLPDHVNYFTPSSLKAMAAKAGFSTQIKNPWNLMFDDNIHALLRRAS